MSSKLDKILNDHPIGAIYSTDPNDNRSQKTLKKQIKSLFLEIVQNVYGDLTTEKERKLRKSIKEL